MSRFRINTLFAVIGNFSQTAALAAIIVTVAKLGSRDLVGQFSYAMAICTPLFLLAQLRLRDLSATDGNKEVNTEDYFRLSIISNAIAFACVPIIVLILGMSTEFLVLTLMIGLWRIVTSFSYVVFGYHQKSMSMKAVARMQITHCISTVVSFVTVFYLTRSLAMSVAAVFAANLAVWLLMDIRTLGNEVSFNDVVVKQPDAWKRLVPIGLEALPMGVAGAIFALNMVIPRGLIEEHFSFAELGVFSGLAFMARFGTPVMQALGQTASSQIAKAIHKHDPELLQRMISRIAGIALSAGLVLVVGGWFLGPKLMTIVYESDYVVTSESFALMMGYATLVYVSTVLTYCLIAGRRLKSQLAILSVTVATVFVSGSWLIPEYGIEGACWSLFISAVVRLAGTGFVVLSIFSKTRAASLTLKQGGIA